MTSMPLGNNTGNQSIQEKEEEKYHAVF